MILSPEPVEDPVITELRRSLREVEQELTKLRERLDQMQGRPGTPGEARRVVPTFSDLAELGLLRDDEVEAALLLRGQRAPR